MFLCFIRCISIQHLRGMIRWIWKTTKSQDATEMTLLKKVIAIIKVIFPYDNMKASVRLVLTINYWHIGISNNMSCVFRTNEV